MAQCVLQYELDTLYTSVQLDYDRSNRRNTTDATKLKINKSGDVVQLDTKHCYCSNTEAHRVPLTARTQVLLFQTTATYLQLIFSL